LSDPFESLLERLVPGAGHRASSDADAPALPASLGLEALGVLGRGATGWVYRARDPVLDRIVAIKVSRPEGGAEAREAMLREARTTTRLAHPAVLPVHRVVAADGRLCIEFQLAPATTFAARMFDGWGDDWPLVRRLVALQGVAGALARAADLGVVHGDVHPGNLAVGDAGEPYVLDWSGAPADGLFRGTPSHAAPEQLAGGGGSAAADVFALGAIAWELCTGKPLRPRHHEEPTGAYLARCPTIAIAKLTGVDPALARLVDAALSADPGARPTARSFFDGVADVVTGNAERGRRIAEAEQLLDVGRAAMERYREIERRLVEEEQVLVVQRAKVPGHAPLADKRPIWEAEDRAAALRDEQSEMWLEAVEGAMQATTLWPASEAAREALAELWWERMRSSEGQPDAELALRRVRRFDTGRWGRVLDAPSHVSVDVDTVGATVEIARYVRRDLLLVPEVVEVRTAPLTKHPLGPGSWRLTVRAPGKADSILPIALGRLEHLRTKVRMYTAAQIGDGWRLVPAGAFRMGGDSRARNPIAPCTPHIGDRFVTTTCVTAADWLAFLDDIAPDEAARRAPGEVGVFGGHHAFWTVGADGRWTLPAPWEPSWPIMGVNLHDAAAYAAWRSAREGRVVRVPTEEEWEKAARGADGRGFPWGDGFDATFCHMRESKPGAPRPAPVGSYPVDTSPYGVHDMAGGVREWTSSTYSEGQVVIRGGTWGDDAIDCRVACRAGLQPPFRFSFVGFRLVSEQPRPG
jgi:formylglycine-generating enzyme required for sulfatase activity